MIKIRRKVKPQFIAVIIGLGLVVSLILIFINLALNSPSSAENIETEPFSSSAVVFTSEPTKATEKTTAEVTTEPTEKTTQKPTKKSESKKDSDKKSESSSKSESSNNSNNNNYYNEPAESKSSNKSTSSSKTNSSSNTQKTTTKPATKSTTKPTTKPTQIQNNIYLSYSSISANKGDVIFLSLINAENGVSWSISNSSVLQNYGGGGTQCSFKALKKGSATITATYNGKSYYCTVTIT